MRARTWIRLWNRRVQCYVNGITLFKAKYLCHPSNSILVQRHPQNKSRPIRGKVLIWIVGGTLAIWLKRDSRKSNYGFIFSYPKNYWQMSPTFRKCFQLARSNFFALLVRFWGRINSWFWMRPLRMWTWRLTTLFRTASKPSSLIPQSSQLHTDWTQSRIMIKLLWWIKALLLKSGLLTNYWWRAAYSRRWFSTRAETLRRFENVLDRASRIRKGDDFIFI